MGTKILFLGLTLILTVSLTHVPAAVIVGQVLMIVGCVLLLFNK